MKPQIFAYLIVAGISVNLISCSCKKNYSCVCTGGIAGGKTTTQIKAYTKQDAKNKCEANNPTSPYWNDAMVCKLQ